MPVALRSQPKHSNVTPVFDWQTIDTGADDGPVIAMIASLPKVTCIQPLLISKPAGSIKLILTDKANIKLTEFFLVLNVAYIVTLRR